MDATRRNILAGSAMGAGLAGSARAADHGAGAGEDQAAAALLERYIGFGGKASGGPGDIAAGAWMEASLRGFGFKTERQPFSAPWLAPRKAELETGGARAAVWPQAIVVPTGPAGVAGRLALVEPWSPPADLTRKIALIPLPFGRWSTATAPAIRTPVSAALGAGALAAVVITTGPTGEALALNADGVKPMFAKPVANLAPKAAAPFLAAAANGAEARLTVDGEGGRREAFNLIGRLDRGKGRWLVVSTPRSGWHGCAGERGGGIAVWLMLAEWAAKRLDLDLAFVSNSGHEYENLGATHLLDAAAPPPGKTALWVHLGANVAARDWHELGGALSPLPSADPQRVLMATPDLIPACRAAFKGLPGLEAPYAAGAGSAGELTHILAAGYPRVAGVFGAHRFHHAEGDDGRCVSGALTAQAAEAFKALIGGALNA